MAELLAPRYWLTWVGVGFFWLIHWLPNDLRQWLGRMIGRLAWHLNHKRRKIVLINLGLCFPQWSKEKKEQLARRHFQIMGQSLIDSSLLWFGSDERVLSVCELQGWEHVENAWAKNRGIIHHVAHASGLEFGAMTIGSRRAGLGPFKPLKNPVVNRFVYRSRTRPRIGNLVAERKDGFRPWIKALKQGKSLYMLSDEDLGTELAAFVKLFAEPKATLYSAGRLASVANAVVLPTITVFDFALKKYVTHIFPALEAFPTGTSTDDAAMLNRSLEQMIMLMPEQYMWTLKLFKTRQDDKGVY